MVVFVSNTILGSADVLDEVDLEMLFALLRTER